MEEKGLDDYLIKYFKLTEDNFEYKKFDSENDFNLALYTYQELNDEIMQKCISDYYKSIGVNLSREEKGTLYFESNNPPVSVEPSFWDFGETYMWEIRVRKI